MVGGDDAQKLLRRNVASLRRSLGKRGAGCPVQIEAFIGHHARGRRQASSTGHRASCNRRTRAPASKPSAPITVTARARGGASCRRARGGVGGGGGRRGSRVGAGGEGGAMFWLVERAARCGPLE
jgi:hypothetical protein